MRSWLGDWGISLLTSLNVSTVKGLEFIIASVSMISVLRFPSFKIEPCVFSSASRIVSAERIWCSYMPPMCEASDGFFCHLTQSVPLFSRCCLICSRSISSKAFFWFTGCSYKIAPITWPNKSFSSSSSNKSPQSLNERICVHCICNFYLNSPTCKASEQGTI